MQFCKKCHKIIIKNVYTLKNLGNRCRCEGDMVHLVCEPEMVGFMTAVIAKKKRCGLKRKVARELNSA